MPIEERDAIRTTLLKYCELNTLAMVMLYLLSFLSMIGGLGYAYPPIINNNPELKIRRITGDDKMIKMLAKGRTDVMIGFDYITAYLIKELGLQKKIVKEPYVDSDPSPSFMAISKKSPLYRRIDDIKVIYKNLLESGEVDKIFRKYIEAP